MKALKGLVVAAALLPMVVMAQTNMPNSELRQQRQEQRIHQGVSSGQLTEREAARLERGQAHVDRMQERAASDGQVTARERARIHQAQDVQSRHVAREKHDRQRDMNHDGRADRRGQRR